MQKKIKVAVIGLGFGGAFVPIYKEHPDVSEVVVFDPNKELEKTFKDQLGLSCDYASFEDILQDPTIDAVHLVTPIPLHAKQSVAVLESGKHCACTVPMATSIEDLEKIIAAKRKSGKNYMFMETTLYTYQYLYVKELLEKGELGRIQLLRGSHYQDMERWPDYWMGLPPMHYGTHAIAPSMMLANSRLVKVNAFGSGTMREELVKRYNNPFPAETAVFSFENGLKAEVTRTLFETARVYQEGLFVYGSKASFEWGFEDGDKPILEKMGGGENRGNIVTKETVTLPNFHHRLPKELWHFTVGGNYDPLNPQDSLKEGAGGGHHGSHPHLVNEFVRSIIEERKPAIDEITGANITAAGICAHISAMKDGETVMLPDFTK